eukprot:9319897-Alexandrium_andersonii.AAC.1
MSASLVGSEMCIRDRFSPHPTSVHLLFNETPPRPPNSNPSKRRPSPAPVSYTHLTLPTICSV